jgi:hypothetical protein
LQSLVFFVINGQIDCAWQSVIFGFFVINGQIDRFSLLFAYGGS